MSEGESVSSTPADPRVAPVATRSGESVSDSSRRARLLAHEQWLIRFHADAERIEDEDVNAEPEAW